MKIQCKLVRPHGTQVTLDGALYDFQPDAHGLHVCEVEREDHIERFLSIGEGYRALTDAPEVAVTGEVPTAAPTLTPADDDPEPEPETAPGDDDEPDEEEQVALEDMTDAELATLYVNVFGKKPNGKAKRETLIARIEEADAS